MKESHEEARRELKHLDARVRSFRLSILNALRYKAKLGSIEKAADKLGEDRGNLSKRLKRFEQDWPLISRVVDAVRKESLFEKASSKEARKKAMQEKDIDISRNKPKLIDTEMVQEADMVIMMGCDARGFCPAPLLKKVVDWELEDPQGQPIEKIREIRDDIERRVTKLIGETR